VCDERRGKELQNIVKCIPLDRLMIETDAPYLFPRNAPKKHSRNEPQYLPYVLQKLSQCMNVPVSSHLELEER
jgi:TatD DNase family protein